MANFTVNDHQIVNDISENEVFLNFQKADFDSVWGDFSSDSLSDSDQVLFEEPVTSTSSEASLWKELENSPFNKRKNKEVVSYNQGFRYMSCVY